MCLEAGLTVALYSFTEAFIVSLILQEAHQRIHLQVLSCGEALT